MDGNEDEGGGISFHLVLPTAGRKDPRPGLFVGGPYGLTFHCLGDSGRVGGRWTLDTL